MQVGLFQDEIIGNRSNGTANKVASSDRAFHDWYRFVLSFPPHLVREYFEKFGLTSTHTVLDPFCGTGTTLVEAKLNGISSIGVEANPMAHFAAGVKTDWSVNADELLRHARTVAESTDGRLRDFGTEPPRTLSPEAFSLLLTDSISPLPLHKSLILAEEIQRQRDERFFRHELLALAKALVCSIGNLHFGPEVGVSRKKKTDALVIENWLSEVESMADDIRSSVENGGSSVVHKADARCLDTLLKLRSIDAVFSSPPYPNEKDYTRTTRLESVLLGFIDNKAGLRALKQGLLRSNTRNVYRGDDDDRFVAENREVREIADLIEKRRIELGKTSGFERLYGKVTKLYFGGMARHLASLRPLLKPGAKLGYVVGDQASYLRVMIRTGRILADIAESLGYEVVGIDLFRTRFATATRERLREEVIVLHWPG